MLWINEATKNLPVPRGEERFFMEPVLSLSKAQNDTQSFPDKN